MVPLSHSSCFGSNLLKKKEPSRQIFQEVLVLFQALNTFQISDQSMI